MSKSLLQEATVDAFVRRLQNLQADATPAWGSMSAAEMLLHCNRIHEHLLTAEPTKKGTTLRQHFARLVFLHSPKLFPKHVQTPKRNNTKGQIETSAFDSEKQRFLQLLRRFPTHAATIQLPHPFFGDLNQKQWGRFAFKHTDHHFRQFGL